MIEIYLLTFLFVILIEFLTTDLYNFLNKIFYKPQIFLRLL